MLSVGKALDTMRSNIKLSIIIPLYNEEKTIEEVLAAVSKAKVQAVKEIIIIDDGSTDASARKVKKFIARHKKKGPEYLLISKPNGGKGSAVKAGIKRATGDIVLIQDADMEYDPNEYQILIDPIVQKKCKVVYGSRTLRKGNKYSMLSFYLGGRLVTLVTNLLYFSRLTDEPTCYKVFAQEVISTLTIKGDKFEWEPEVTAKILKKGIKIYEVPISYFPRQKKEGKKINWRDGLHAIYTLFYWRFKK